jgi:glutamyl-tRNA synthetase
MNLRVRFAPSPTGPLHIGGVRTALYNYLFARKNNGAFVLRIEDTDQSRYVEGAEEYIVESLDWMGLIPDEGPGFGGDYGPYRQSERRDIYARHITDLLNNESAYYAFDTPEELESMRERMRAEGVHSPKYDHTMRMRMRNSLTMERVEVDALLESGTPHTVRLKMPIDQDVMFQDTVRGDISINTNELDDKILMKADGLPTYHFANVVDDHLMKITHVTRGEEWLPSTAHHVLLYRAFGWVDTMPEFAHLPLILKPTGKGKLSKRDGAKFGFPVFPLEWPDPEGNFEGFREIGFLPEAMLNFLAFLGWNPGTEQEIFSEEELITAFSVEHIIKSGARFDYDKALWFNSQHIQTLDPHRINEIVAQLLKKHGFTAPEKFVNQFVTLYKDRVKLLEDFLPSAEVYLGDLTHYEESFVRKKWNGDLNDHFNVLRERLSSVESFDNDSIQDIIKTYIQDNALNFGVVFQLMRTALSGSPKGPDLFAMMQLIGRETVLVRLEKCLEVFDAIQAKPNG